MFQGGQDLLDPVPLTGQWSEDQELSMKSTDPEITGDPDENSFSGNCGGKGLNRKGVRKMESNEQR